MLAWVQTKWLRLGFFQSICLAIKYQSGKANATSDALSQSQKKEVKGSTDDPIVAAAAVEEQVLTLSGFSVDLTAEDLQKSMKAYKENKSYVVAYSKLSQGQKYKDDYLTPSGLLGRMRGVNNRSSFLSLCGSRF